MKARYFLSTIVAIWGCSWGSQCTVFSEASNSIARSEVQFVGCKSDGQVGPLRAPKVRVKRLAIPAEVADRLAFYQAEEGFGVLAPRGWHCFSTYGSNGSNLFVTPEPMNGKMLLASNWKGFSGQAIQVSNSVGDSSGRFAVARVIARVFPDHKQFVDDVIAEGIEPLSSFPFGPYPADKLTYRSKNIVEFETPANSKGLGTDSMLLANGNQVRGVAILFGDEPNLVQGSARLSPENQSLVHAIISQLESEVVASQGR